MTIREKFVAAVRQHFEQITPLLDVELALATDERPRKARFLAVEYDSPDFSEDFPVSLWAMGRNGEPVSDGHWLLRGRAVVVPPEIYEAEEYESINPWATASDLFEEWFMTRWRECASRAIPAFIGHHDSNTYTNLLTGEQVNWDDIVGSLRR